jgi:DNA repair exonuclease SbcCD nuclease subunit
MKIDNFKRAFIISDTHLGYKNNSNEWLDIQKSYFNNFLMPLISKNKKDGDVLIHCGDVFDSRTAIGIFTLNYAVEIFEKLSNIIPIIVLVGNHDSATKYNNDVHSLKFLNFINNISVIDVPQSETICNNKILFMPWMSTKESEINCINENRDCNIIFSHMNIAGMNFNRYVVVKDGIETQNIETFKRVFSGHIHYRQEKNNIIYVGSPYQLDRGDINNNKGVYLYDFISNDLIFFENNISPKYLKYAYDEILTMINENNTKELENNFIDIVVDNENINKRSYIIIYDNLKNCKSIEIIPSSKDNSLDINENFDIDKHISNIEDLDILKIAYNMFDDSDYDDKMKMSLKELFKNFYEKAERDL